MDGVGHVGKNGEGGQVPAYNGCPSEGWGDEPLKREDDS